jgi:hypothetical protein
MAMRQRPDAYLGLDFGTSTTLLARTRGAGVGVLPLGRATEWLPSIVGFESVAAEPLVAEAAEALLPSQILRSVKRAITEDRDTLSIELADGLREVDADEAVSLIVREALRRADEQNALDGVAGIRAGCPAMWDRGQRLRLLAILESAGAHVPLIDLIDEPVAAAVAWVNHRQVAANERVAGRLVVFDYGGGTLDIAVCDIAWDEDAPEVTVMACLGIPYAGDVLDSHLYTYVMDQLENDSRYDGSAVQNAAILREVRLAKETLSDAFETALRLQPFGLPDVRLTRAELENAFRGQLSAAVEYVMAALRAARLRENDAPTPQELMATREEFLVGQVNFVLLAGGMSQIPLVGDELQRRLPSARVERIEARRGGTLRGPQDLVAAGLVHDPATYDRLNLHRPGFNVRIEWRAHAQPWVGENVYRAHTPLYASHDVFAGNFRLGYTGAVEVPANSRAREGRLIVTSESGDRLDLRLDGVHIEGLTMPVRPGAEVKVKIYVDGQMLVTVDGHQPRFVSGRGGLRIERWQVVRGPASRRRQIDLSTEYDEDRGKWPYPHK